MQSDQEKAAIELTRRVMVCYLERQEKIWRSQGDTVETARDSLREAIELFLETAGEEEVQRWLHAETVLSQLEVNVG